MYIRYLASPRYTKEVDKLQGYLNFLMDEMGRDDIEIREALNQIIAHALQLRVNIEHEKRCRGEFEEE